MLIHHIGQKTKSLMDALSFALNNGCVFDATTGNCCSASQDGQECSFDSCELKAKVALTLVYHSINTYFGSTQGRTQGWLSGLEPPLTEFA